MTRNLCYLIVLTIVCNGSLLFLPILASNDANFYSIIAKNIVINHDWINLTFASTDWLDKPHFPFWLTALSYKIFGINTFSYILPGFLFHLLGAYYTYLLSLKLYRNRNTAIFSALIYLTSVHLLLSSIDVRAEAFLLGEIVPACYYWLLYHVRSSYKNLLLGAFFSALAVMTKGIFVLITIFSSLIILFIIKKEYWQLLSRKWLIAFLTILLFITPELFALYLQFDMHPEKLVFAKHNVSGIRFFFFDSQFGRFFNNGPITNISHSNHYIYFIHTFLWAFLPWSLAFIAAIFVSNRQKFSYVYLLAAFMPTFILFSLTKFQLDHYTNIIIPFASILTANYLNNLSSNNKIYLYLQITLIVVLSTLEITLCCLINKFYSISFVIATVIIVFLMRKLKNRIVILSVYLVNIIFITLMLINAVIYSKYDAGYNLANTIKPYSKNIPVIDYNANLLSLEFNLEQKYLRINNKQALLRRVRPYFLVINQEDWHNLKININSVIIKQTYGLKQEKFVASLLSDKFKQNNTKIVYLVYISS